MTSATDDAIKTTLSALTLLAAPRLAERVSPMHLMPMSA